MNEKKVYKAIAEVTSKLAKEGISKARKNEQQGYKFRGIDDVYNALAPFLAEAKLCILPHVEHRECVERINHKGTALFYVTVQVRFSFVSAEDGSEHQVVTYGEAMDSGDKATNKAMQAFCIPTEGDNDADGQTHEVKAAPSRITPVAGSLAALLPSEQETARDIAATIVDYWNNGQEVSAYEAFYEAGWSNEMKLGIWDVLTPNSKVRNGIKKIADENRKKVA
jgi:hypothetical protein